MNKTNHYRGKESPCYKTGIGFFFAYRRSLKGKPKFCNRCGKDLTNANRYTWCLHHIDHDRTHNTIDNFELLCKRCHQLEHSCKENIPKTYQKVCKICGKSFTAKIHNCLYCESCRAIWRRMKRKGNFEYVCNKIRQGNV